MHGFAPNMGKQTAKQFSPLARAGAPSVPVAGSAGNAATAAASAPSRPLVGPDVLSR